MRGGQNPGCDHARSPDTEQMYLQSPAKHVDKVPRRRRPRTDPRGPRMSVSRVMRVPGDRGAADGQPRRGGPALYSPAPPGSPTAGGRSPWASGRHLEHRQSDRPPAAQGRNAGDDLADLALFPQPGRHTDRTRGLCPAKVSEAMQSRWLDWHRDTALSKALYLIYRGDNDLPVTDPTPASWSASSLPSTSCAPSSRPRSAKGTATAEISRR